MYSSFIYYKQLDSMDCGPTCLRMVAKHYGRSYSLENLRRRSGITRLGVSLLGIGEAAESIGFRTVGVKISYERLRDEMPLPCIAHWRQSHFVVVYKIVKDKIYVADPGKGLIRYTKEEFIEGWQNKNKSNNTGIALLLEPTPRFYEEEGEENKGISFGLLFRYLASHHRLIAQLMLGLLAGSILQLVLPFLTQSVVDIGINTNNLSFVYLVLIAQVMLLFGRLTVDFIRSWIMLHMSTRISISILSDFLIKLMRLPISYFDTKMFGDIMQRIGDQGRIQSFLTGSSLSTLFSLFNLVVFSMVLASFNLTIFGVFVLASILYISWIVLFLKKRRDLDFKRFDIASQNQSTLVQLIGGMQEIKMNNCEKQRRWEWEHIQAKSFRQNMKSLSLSQYQQVGTFFINEGKNIFITFLAAQAVINGQLTLGGMMAMQYIVGQLNSPIEQILGFVQSLQDAKISLERLNEIHAQEDEEPAEVQLLQEIPPKADITINNLSFTYPGAGEEPVLKNLNLSIPYGKTTAIVGMSGSGKTTLLKLLLKFYKPTSGEIRVGKSSLWNVSHSLWRSRCGVVMQEGYIFSDTIANNITIADEHPDMERLSYAIEMANLTDFIESLPLRAATKIGAEGNGISQGQKQRILIARAIYKNPDVIFFDEATNSLDANNEKVIMENLEQFFKGKTVIVVAHRLSTVKNADQIVVLEKGEIVEQNTHSKLVQQKGKYFELVRNQLELAN
jgi:ATP-binding cassette, subfamily B, bacterial